MATFILIHSPLVGAMTWRLVADELRRGGHQAVVPSLFDAPDASQPYWRQHANAVVQALEGEAPTDAPVLVAHSGAGPLLPAIRQALSHPVAGYIFADTDLPRDGASRFDLFDSVEDVEMFRAEAIDGLIPSWTADDLRGSIPDAAVRERFAAELRPLPIAIYEEALPAPMGWDSAPCAYLHFSKSYDNAAHEAQAHGWPYKKLAGGHFLPLVDAPAVAAALTDLARRMKA